MPEPGVKDRNFNRPTAKAMRGPAGSRPGGRRLRIPGEYAEFRLENGRALGEVLGPEFFMPPDRRPGGGERARLREGGSAPAEIPPREREEFAALEGALRDAAERKRAILRDHERDQWFFRNRRMDRAELAKRQESHRKRIAEENAAIEEAELKIAGIKARAAPEATPPPRREDAPEEAEAARAAAIPVARPRPANIPGRAEGGGPEENETALGEIAASGPDSTVATGIERENWDKDQRDQFNNPMRVFRQAFNGMSIFNHLDGIRSDEDRRKGERTELMKTPRQQERLEAAPPTGEPDIFDLTEEEWQARQAESRRQIREPVESFAHSYNKLQEKMDPADFEDDPDGWLLGKAGNEGAGLFKDFPLISDQYRLLVRTLREHGVDLGDPDAVMDALYDDEFRSLLDERRNELIGNTLVNETVLKPVGYKGGAQKPLESGEGRVRPRGEEDQTQRLPDKLDNAGYAREVDTIMMEIYRLRSIDKGIHPDLLTPYRLVEQQRDQPAGNRTRHERYASLPPYPKVATNRALVERLAKVLEKQGEVRDRLKASEAQPAFVDDPKAAVSRVLGDVVSIAPNMIPGLAKVIGANEAFYKTIAEFEIDSKDYRAMAEVAITEKFAEKWKANIDNYMLKILGKEAWNMIKPQVLAPIKSVVDYR